jgi:uncharacterized protein YcbK (DUF882 family)
MLGRRSFLQAGACSLLVLSLGRGRARAAGEQPRRLRMRHAHTGEHLDVVYREDGAFVPEALAEIDRFLRDFRTGDVRHIDPGVLDIAWSVVLASGGAGAELEIVSGYRSPATNALLRKHGRGVASRSLHLEGRAIDLRLPGFPTARLRDAALALQRGGVGFYPGSDFVHVDTGRVRFW